MVLINLTIQRVPRAEHSRGLGQRPMVNLYPLHTASERGTGVNLIYMNIGEWCELQHTEEIPQCVNLVQIVQCAWFRLCNVPGSDCAMCLVQIVQCAWFRLCNVPGSDCAMCLVQNVQCTWFRMCSPMLLRLSSPLSCKS